MEGLLWQYTLLDARDRVNEIDMAFTLTEPTNFSLKFLA